MVEKSNRFRIRVWPEGCALFDLKTGDTHVLDSLSAFEFLGALKQIDNTELSELTLPALSHAEHHAAASAARQRLFALGLIE